MLFSYIKPQNIDKKKKKILNIDFLFNISLFQHNFTKKKLKKKLFKSQEFHRISQFFLELMTSH